MGLVEGKRVGRPPNVSEEVKKAETWLGHATQQVRELLPRLQQEGAELFSVSTLRRLGYR